MQTGAVIVAAGMSSRMGDFKPMLKIGAMSMVQRIIANYQQAGVFPIVLVTGYRGDELEKHVAKTGVICIRNENYATTQMFDSAKIGFSYIMTNATGLSFHRLTFPSLQFIQLSVSWNPTPMWRNPYAMEKKAILYSFPALYCLPSWKPKATRLKAAIDQCCDHVEIVQVGDEGILQDADTPEDYHQLIERHNDNSSAHDRNISCAKTSSSTRTAHCCCG